jgi:hypothetical protein
MATREELYEALRNADKAGDAEGARKLAAYIQSLPAAAPAVQQAEKQSFGAEVKQQVGNLIGGAVRGAGSIGATILYPIDKVGDMIDRANGVSETGLRGLVTGEKRLTRNEQRRHDMTDALRDLGADPDSIAFKTGKLGAEVAGTLGTGGAVANAAARLPGVAAAAPNLLAAIQSGGMSAGSATGLANPLLRAAGGAIAGGVSAGLVNPDDAAAGAAIGSVLPGALQLAGAGGRAIGRVLRGPEQAPEVAQAVQAARQAGYVVPPTQARASLGNRLLEGFSGKLTTAQNASARNQAVTNAKAAQAVGLPVDSPITVDALNQVRRSAGQAYDAVANAGTITPTAAYDKALDAIVAPFKTAAQGFQNARPNAIIQEIESLRSPQFDAAAAVEKIKEVRGLSDTAFAGGDKQLGKAYRAAADAIEDAVDAHLQAIGATDALRGLRDARQLIAKTYSIERALNPTTGTIDAKKLAAQLKKGKPLSGELKEVADFASRFPKAAQAIEGMGSLPQTSPLDWALGGATSAATANPLLLASVAARPAARALALSPVVQDRLVQGANPLLSLTIPEGVSRVGRQAVLLGGSDR